MATVIYVTGTGKFPDRRIFASIHDYADAHGWNLQSVEHLECVEDVADLVRLWSPSGFIVNRSSGERNQIPFSAFGDIPVVCFQRPEPLEGRFAAEVYNNASETAAVAARELLSLGLANYAFVNWPTPSAWSPLREREFIRIIRRHGKRAFSFTPVQKTPRKTVPEIAEWMRSLAMPVGVFAANDSVALDVASACRLLGLAIPDDVAIVGVDNDTALCEDHSPSISSVALDYSSAGLIAAEALSEMMRLRAGGQRSAHLSKSYTPGQLVRRESTRRFVKHDRAVSAAVETIRKEACRGLTAKRVLESIPCSRRMAEMRFRSITGRSVLEEILSVRMETAKGLLRQRGEMAIDAIASMAGYKSTSAFSKVFHEKTGLTPSEWRKANKGNAPRKGRISIT